MKHYLRVLHDACYIWLDAVGDAKVNQLQGGIHYDKIGRLQVTVNDSCVEKTKTFQNE